jgi:dextranase
LDSEVASATASTVDGREVRALEGRFDELSSGTYCITARDEGGVEIDEEFVTVGAHPGERPVHGFATSFVDEALSDVLEWNRALRSTVVQLYDWMASYTEPLPEAEAWRDPSQRPVSRESMRRLAASLGELGAVALAYAPIYAVGLEYAAAHPDELLYDDQGQAVRFLDQIVLANPANHSWQEHFARSYGAALDQLGMTGLHVDTYGYPRVARDATGAPVDVTRAYEEFLEALRRARPADLISFNQVNGVPSAARIASAPSFRYCEIWPPNVGWRHFEGLLDRSAGRAGHVGTSLGAVRGSLACYPPVWGEGDLDESARAAALATVLRTEAIATSLASSVLMFGDRRAVLKDPYYPKHERLNPLEAQRVVAWRRMTLRTRDLFIDGEDTSWFEIDDENGSVSVESTVPVRPEPEGGALFVRVAHGQDYVAISLVDLSASADGSWRSRSGEGSVDSATVRVLLDRPSRWRADVAHVESNSGSFHAAPTHEEPHRQGRALRIDVPLRGGWSVVRIRLASDSRSETRRK